MTTYSKKKEQELLEEFRRLAIEHDTASQNGDYKVANRCVDEIDSLVLSLWQNGQRKEALSGLCDLARSDDGRIALMAIAYSIEFYPEVGKELHRLKHEKTLIGLGARQTLENWENGKMKVLRELLDL